MAIMIPRTTNRMGKLTTGQAGSLSGSATANPVGTTYTGGAPRAGGAAASSYGNQPFVLGTTLDQLNAQKATADRQRVTPGWDARRAQINGAIAKLTPAQTPTTQPTEQPTAVPQEQNPLFRTAYDFVPKTQEQDPIYNFQKTQGIDELDKYLAAKGLRQSGARDAAAAKFFGQLGADAYGRQMNTANNEADRYERATSKEADRLQTGQQNQFNNLYSLLQLGAQQSPMAYGVDATNKSAGMADSQGKTLASFLASMYPKTGGGGYIPPFQSKPDMTNANYANINANTNNTNNWGNLAANLIGGLFK